MYLPRPTFDAKESLDFTRLPGFEKLNEDQRCRVQEAFERGYLAGRQCGIKTAIGRGYETAKLAIDEVMKPSTPAAQKIPLSIFAGLDNCY